MRTISARQFRLTFGDLTFPVEVVLHKDGVYRVLGTWTPNWTPPPSASEMEPAEVERYRRENRRGGK